MNLSKSKNYTKVDNIFIQLDNHIIKNFENYIYLGHTIKLGKANQTPAYLLWWLMEWKQSHLPLNLPINSEQHKDHNYIREVSVDWKNVDWMMLRSGWEEAGIR